ncbi:hypothetical protein AAY473_001629 [Plecturocebus cupreus]
MLPWLFLNSWAQVICLLQSSKVLGLQEGTTVLPPTPPLRNSKSSMSWPGNLYSNINKPWLVPISTATQVCGILLFCAPPTSSFLPRCPPPFLKSAVARSWLNTTSASWVLAVLLCQPPE